MAPFVVLMALSAAPVIELGPVQASAGFDENQHRASCDLAGCFVSWTELHPPYDLIRSASVTPGAVTSFSVLDIGRGVRLQGFTAAQGRRFHVYDFVGTGGDYRIFLSLASSGATLDDLGSVVLSSPAGVPWVTSCGAIPDSLLCVLTKKVGAFSELVLQRVSFDGGLLGAPITVPTRSLLDSPSVVALGHEWLVAWAQRFDGNQLDVFASLVSGDGGLFPEVLVSGHPENEYSLTATACDGGVLLAWARDTAPPGVELAAVFPDAGVQRLALSLPSAKGPSLSWHGDRFVVAVEKLDGGTVRIQASLVPWTGTSPAVQIFESAGPHDVAPQLARVDDSTALLTWFSYLPDGGMRQFFTFLGTRAEGESCSADASCASGPCLAGSCTTPDAGPQDAGVQGARALGVACGCGHAGDAWATMLGLLFLVWTRRR